MPELQCIPQYYPVVYHGTHAPQYIICPTVLTCNCGYGGVHGCSVDGCGCGMPPDHPQYHLCYTLLIITGLQIHSLWMRPIEEGLYVANCHGCLSCRTWLM